MSVERIQQHFRDSAAVKLEALETLSMPIAAAIDTMFGALANGNRILACGNGGSAADAQRFAAELIDRFGPLPDEVRHLFEIVTIKQLAKQAGVEKIDAGPKGGTVAFRGNAFANPVKLIQFISQHAGTMRVRPDQKIVVTRDWPTPDDRLKGAKALLGQLAKLAA